MKLNIVVFITNHISSLDNLKLELFITSNMIEIHDVQHIDVKRNYAQNVTHILEFLF